MLITVFTPSYNRAYALPRLFESLRAQTFTDFEWIIVNDGSSDNTEELVSGFMANASSFPIRYIKTENGGKHRAINKGVQQARGELFFTLDSDDYLLEDSLRYIADEFIKMDSDVKSKICALFGLKIYPDGRIIGKTFEGERLLTSSIDSLRHNIRGDKGEVFLTKILQKYPYPEIEGEKFATECIIWDRMAHDGYKTMYFNKPLSVCQYLEDGLTHQGWGLYAQNPIQWSICLGQNYRFGKYSWFEMTSQLFVYYLNVRERWSLNEMSKHTMLSKLQIISAVVLQYALNAIRRTFNRPYIVK